MTPANRGSDHLPSHRTDPPTVAVLGRPLYQWVVLFWLGLALTAVIFTTVTVTNQGAQRSSFLQFFAVPALFVAGVVSLCIAGMRSRIEVRDDYLVIVNLYFE